MNLDNALGVGLFGGALKIGPTGGACAMQARLAGTLHQVGVGEVVVKIAFG